MMDPNLQRDVYNNDTLYTFQWSAMYMLINEEKWSAHSIHLWKHEQKHSDVNTHWQRVQGVLLQ